MTRADLVADYFRARPGTWIDGRELAQVGGYYGWRTRVSNIRRAPYAMTIQNRQRRVERADGTHYTVSEYRFIESVKQVMRETPEAADTASGLLF